MHKFFEEMLRNNTNARVAKDGILVDTESGLIHFTEVFNSEDFNGLRKDASYFAPFCSRKDLEVITHPSTASDYLLLLRAESIVDNPRLVRTFKKRKGNKKKWSLEGYYLERKREEIYINSLSKGNYEKVKNLPSGSAYLNNVNALCMNTKKGNVIAISEALENFLYFMNIFQFGKAYGMKIQDCIHSFVIAQRIMAGHESFDFDLDPRCFLPKEFEEYIRYVTDLQYQFILGHEYAHHLLGHVDDKNLIKGFKSNFIKGYEKNETIEYYRYSHNLEYDADWYAIKNIRNNRNFKEDIANAAFLFMMYLNTSQTILDFVNPSRGQRVSTHPEPLDRLFKIRSKLNNKYGYSREDLEKNIEILDLQTKTFINEWLVFNFDTFEGYGSVYLPSYRKKSMIDRVDY